jgi:23S rRNA (cytidine1920-2'-O)/16S rRNA (cytidine1409-2'-O)-methyltransferase
MTKRADILVVESGLLESRSKAQAEILAGHVLADGVPIKKPSQKIPVSAKLSLHASTDTSVSRAGQKLEFALEFFNLSLKGREVLDIGASTGGFTEVALAAGATHVAAVDVGSGQLHSRLQADPRVTSIENLNARFLTKDQLSKPIDAIVCDVSFISLTKVLPSAMSMVDQGALLVALIKPQFEAGPKRVGKGGIVKDPQVHEDVCGEIVAWLERQPGWQTLGLVESPIVGSDGNKEFLVAATKSKAA